jgi:hypothetical protein
VGPGGSGCGKGASSAQRNILLITCCSYGDVVLVWNPVKNVELPSAPQEEDAWHPSIGRSYGEHGQLTGNIQGFDTREEPRRDCEENANVMAKALSS